MRIGLNELLKKIWIVLAGAFSSFRRNNDFTSASSLAFSVMLALIPALFLLTVLLGAVIGSSARAVEQTRELMAQLIPAYSHVILQEVNFIARHKGAIGLMNLLILFWSITPLVADMRIALGTVFRKKPSRPFLLEKLFDAAIGMVFLVGLAAVALAGLFLTVMERIRPLRFSTGCLEDAGFFLVLSGVVLALYFTFSKRARLSHLLVGALVTSAFWFALRPAFHLFLTFNPGYGFAFGSFKSLFVVIIWIYISLVLFLFGAEVAAALGRDDTMHIKQLLEGGKNIPAAVMDRHVVRYGKGTVIFSEGDHGSEMYSVLNGRVLIRRGEQELGVVERGKSFGGLSFLLSSPRVASAVALEDVELAVLNNENISRLMNEFPEFVVEMLREMALRLREANRMVD